MSTSNRNPIVNINVIVVTAPSRPKVNWAKAIGAVILAALAQLVR